MIKCETVFKSKNCRNRILKYPMCGTFIEGVDFVTSVKYIIQSANVYHEIIPLYVLFKILRININYELKLCNPSSDWRR